MPVYEDLTRRTLEAQARATLLSAAAKRICDFSRVLRRARRGEDLLRQCAWCGRLNVGGRWVQVESISTALLKRSTSGICPDCFKEQPRTVEPDDR